MKAKYKSYCLICFHPLNDSSLHTLLTFSKVICEKCLKKFKIIHLTLNVLGVETLFLYEYNAFLKKLIYQYKGCYDYELKDVFFFQFKKEIQKKYKGYTIVYPPSNTKDDQIRGFRHIEQMIECLHFKHLNLFYKNKSFKQSSQSFIHRKDIASVIEIKSQLLSIHSKYLIVDDIYTSGSTLKTIIHLLLSHHIPKENIKALILSKTAENVEI